MKKIILILLIILNLPLMQGGGCNSFAQTPDSISYKQFSFIREDLNKIENDSNSLHFFYKKLYELQETKKGRVDIVHIGDSHLQADLFSGTVRQKLQLKFGNAGRGLLFPYHVAKSNEPASYRTTTNIVWDSKRNVFHEKPLPIGISGFTIETTNPFAEINLTVKDQPGLGYSFTKFTLFQEKGLRNYDITICDEINCERGVFRSSDVSNSTFVSELKFDKPISQIVLRNKNTDTLNQKATRIYGMLLENDSAGVLYNMIGVNGAEYRHYVKSKYFTEQLSYLNADLVIVSLGTNEAFSVGFDKVLFTRNIDTLITKIKLASPNASILLTTPADSFRKTRKGRVKNPDMQQARIAIINYCLQNNLPYWDLYEIMGGYGSMGKWFVAQLSAKDRVHFNGKGYKIQGDLFYQALMNGFGKYTTLK
ncbi:MAG: GDSL-type esterase/lipase family protein [Bacteroidia bacterium]|nr:GDSL-type esterase/lipase family protein [Bacteroidia bacterium]